MKYELLSDDTINVADRVLYRIRALNAFGNVEAGDLGGYLESESNLSQYGDAWVRGNARVSDNARVYGNACVSDTAQVCGDAQVYANARVYGNACVGDTALVYGDALVHDAALVWGDAHVYGNAWVYGSAQVGCNAQVKKPTDYLAVGPIGSRNGATTFFRTKDDCIFVGCGCFCGPLTEFRKKVVKTHGNNAHAKAYLAAADFAEMQIDHR